MKKLFIVTILLTAGSVGYSYSILGVFPHAGKSHFNVFEPLMKELARKGHKVTVISHFPQKGAIENYKDISLKGTTELYLSVLDFNLFNRSRFSRFFEFLILLQMGQDLCQIGLRSSVIKKLLKGDRNFDLVIIEYFHNDCFLGIAHKFKTPIVGITTSVMLSWHNPKIGNIGNPSYIPNTFIGTSDRMSFFERVESTAANVLQNLIYNYYYVNILNQRTARDVFGNDVPSLQDISKKVSLMLVNSHFTLNRPRPFVPGVVEVGGMHLGKPKPVPKHIEKWINESTHGVIYFSFGSMIKGHSFPEEKRQMFIRAFSRFPQRILWKWEADTMPGKPENIMIEKWMPQFDILCHPNVKAFIAHGGLLGVTEAVHCGVPLIIMPQFGDQFTNAKAIEASGGGVILDYRSMDEESIYNALKNVLDPSFNKKAKELSARFRDRPMPPLETAIYWVEYVARHGGAPHLRTAAVGMPLYQYLLLDVIAFLAVILFLVMYIFYAVTRAIFRKIFKVKEKVKKN